MTVETTRTEPAASPLKQEMTEEPVLEFALWKSLPYGTRLLLMAVLGVAGLVVQYFFGVWWGAPLLFGAVLLSWVRGFDNNLDKRAFHHDKAWEMVPLERLEEIKKLDKKMRKWDESLFDISNGFGGFCFFLLLAGSGAFLVYLQNEYWYTDLGLIAVVDVGILVLPQWFNGMRTLFRQPDLVIKIDHMMTVVRAVRPQLDSDRVEIKGQLQMQGKDEARVPTDAKLFIRFAASPEHLYGVTAQVVLNRVQGSAYPYFYAVVVSEKGHKLHARVREVPLPSGIILETKSQEEVDIAIVRQHTTRTSGYHTKPATSIATLKTAIRMAERQIAAGETE